MTEEMNERTGERRNESETMKQENSLIRENGTESVLRRHLLVESLWTRKLSFMNSSKKNPKVSRKIYNSHKILSIFKSSKLFIGTLSNASGLPLSFRSSRFSSIRPPPQNG